MQDKARSADNKRSYLRINVPAEVRNKYNRKCEKVYNSRKSGDIPLRRVIHFFINMEEGHELVITSKKKKK